MDTDLRHGVTETQHAVLDMIEKKGSFWGVISLPSRLENAARYAGLAAGTTLSLSIRRNMAIEAAARLIAAADEMGRVIAAGEPA